MKKKVALYCKHLNPLSDGEITQQIKAGYASLVEKPQPEGFILTLVACNPCMAHANSVEAALKVKN